MKDIPIKLGPLALLLTVVSICMTTLAILTFTTARADGSLANTYAQTVFTRYALEAEGQSFLAELDAAALRGDVLSLPGLEQDTAGAYWKVIDHGDACLRIGFTLTGDSYTIITWRQERDWKQDDSIGNLWPGF